jgi:hypothetical protein
MHFRFQAGQKMAKADQVPPWVMLTSNGMEGGALI